jgi:hypothetical protein
MKNKLAESLANVKEATSTLRKLVEDTVPAEKRILLKVTQPNLPLTSKPERRIVQQTASPLAVVAG